MYRPNIIICVLIGYGIVCTYMCFMDMQSCATGLPTSQMAAGALGDKSAQLLISLLLGIVCIGWSGHAFSVDASKQQVVVPQAKWQTASRYMVAAKILH